MVVISRLKNSRVGLAPAGPAGRRDSLRGNGRQHDQGQALEALLALSSLWPAFAGVIFAARTTFINPSSFTFMESAMILSMVVLEAWDRSRRDNRSHHPDSGSRIFTGFFRIPPHAYFRRDNGHYDESSVHRASCPRKAPLQHHCAKRGRRK